MLVYMRRINILLQNRGENREKGWNRVWKKGVNPGPNSMLNYSMCHFKTGFIVKFPSPSFNIYPL